VVIGAYYLSFCQELHHGRMVALLPLFVPNGVAVEITAENNRLPVEPFWIGFDGPVNLNDVIVFEIFADLRSPSRN